MHINLDILEVSIKLLVCLENKYFFVLLHVIFVLEIQVKLTKNSADIFWDYALLF
jgi:hypothetical protein